MPSKPNKTHATAASVDAFIDKQPKASSSRAASDRGAEIGKEVRDDCRALMNLMHELTGAEPYMYGPAIVGYGTYHYKYASGHEGAMRPWRRSARASRSWSSTAGPASSSRSRN